MVSLSYTISTKAPQFVARLQAFWQRIVAPAWPARPLVISDARAIALPAEISDMLDQAIREGSNHELDWLWYAKHSKRAEEQRYCLERARHINPGL